MGSAQTLGNRLKPFPQPSNALNPKLKLGEKERTSFPPKNH